MNDDRIGGRASTPTAVALGSRSLEKIAIVVVLVLFANVSRTFDEIIGRRFITAGLSDLPIVDARQIIRFQLDENGAILESEAGNVAADEGPSNHPRKMIFNKPFLVWLREANAAEPYFAAWIENTELMKPFAK